MIEIVRGVVFEFGNYSADTLDLLTIILDNNQKYNRVSKGLKALEMFPLRIKSVEFTELFAHRAEDGGRSFFIYTIPCICSKEGLFGKTFSYGS